MAAAVDPDALTVVDGRLPIEQIDLVLPSLEQGRRVLVRAEQRLRHLSRAPYLVGVARDTLEKLDRQLTRATREARRATTAARVASAIFGEKEPRSYLLLVQNNAELRGTGGLIGNWTVVHTDDGRLAVDDMHQTSEWNNKLRDAPANYEASEDYHARYDPLLPQYQLQTVNYSPDFPSVAQVLLDRAPLVGLTDLDGVMAVDPLGLAALLKLSGSVEVSGWPTAIGADNVVDVTLHDQYFAFAAGGDTAARSNFVGSVAEAAVAKATSGVLGAPAKLGEVLGKAADGGHILMSFARPAEERAAEQLGFAGKLEPTKSDSLLVSDVNQSANKLDYYLKRSVDYRVRLQPTADGDAATATATATESRSTTPRRRADFPRSSADPSTTDSRQARTVSSSRCTRRSTSTKSSREGSRWHRRWGRKRAATSRRSPWTSRQAVHARCASRSPER